METVLSTSSDTNHLISTTRHGLKIITIARIDKKRGVIYECQCEHCKAGQVKTAFELVNGTKCSNSSCRFQVSTEQKLAAEEAQYRQELAEELRQREIQSLKARLSVLEPPPPEQPAAISQEVVQQSRPQLVYNDTPNKTVREGSLLRLYGYREEWDAIQTGKDTARSVVVGDFVMTTAGPREVTKVEHRKIAEVGPIGLLREETHGN